MGAVNVGAVLTTWHSLPHRARVVLVAMAHMALDEGRPGMAPRRYFGGPGYLAEVLYGPDGIERLDGDGRPVPTVSADKQVQKVLTELVKAGAVRRLTTGGRNHRAEYEVVLTPRVSPTETVEVSPTETVPQPHRNGGVSPTETVGPRNHRNHQEQEEDKITLPAPPTRATGPAVDDEHRIESTGQVWHDVPLVGLEDGLTTADAYAGASVYLERTLGSAQAGDVVAQLVATGAPSYTDAVVRAAVDRGWKP